jgi:glutathione peroxidase
VAEFVDSKFGVTFPMFSKVEVNGDGACDLFKWLTASAPKEDGDGTIAWNFTKFLVGRDGSVVKRFEPMTSPEDIGVFVAGLL